MVDLVTKNDWLNYFETHGLILGRPIYILGQFMGLGKKKSGCTANPCLAKDKLVEETTEKEKLLLSVYLRFFF